ncbi:MAG: hypothetical protein PW792_17590 [Acidobacteriaceae bacterium]|nr:hypothetical protein [Acidobacteriaceae bacterium]
MKSLWRGMAVLLLAMGCFVPAEAQVATTTLNDTVYRADGTPAQGSVVVTWGSFTMANGVSVPAGSKTAVLGSNGAFSMVLAPNAGATPMGSFYTAVYHLADGTVSREYWVIPVTVPGGGAAKLAGVRNQVLPSSVAMQTVSKQYVDSSIAQAQIGAYPLDSSPYVLKAGDTMTGPLELPGDPATPTQAADKNYVDTNVTALTSGLSGKVALLPSGTQVVGQPESTQLQTNRLNGELYASQFATSQNTDGITTALSSPECTDSSCTVIVEPTYPENAVASTDTATQSAHVKDERGASEFDTSLNPKSPSSTYLVGRTGLVTSTITAPEYYQSQHNSVTAGVLQQTMRALSGGSNLSPQSYTSLPYFKSTYGLEYGEGIYNTQGQHVNYTSLAGCYSVGDCIDRSSILTSDGGFRDGSDEGTHQYDYLTQEDPQLFQGTCDTGCVSGSTDLVVAVTAGGSTQGDGRYLMDTTAAKSITTGTLIGGDLTRHFVATFSGSSFPVSTFLATAEVANSQANDAAPGTVTLAIMSSGAPSGYATNTAALPNASGVACVADQDLPPFQIDNFETAAYTVIDGTHIQLTLNKPHDTGATIAVGGLCGYGLEQKVDTVGKHQADLSGDWIDQHNAALLYGWTSRHCGCGQCGDGDGVCQCTVADCIDNAIGQCGDGYNVFTRGMGFERAGGDD